jgi:hypothetical protein
MPHFQNNRWKTCRFPRGAKAARIKVNSPGPRVPPVFPPVLGRLSRGLLQEQRRSW